MSRFGSLPTLLRRNVAVALTGRRARVRTGYECDGFPVSGLLKGLRKRLL